LYSIDYTCGGRVVLVIAMMAINCFVGYSQHCNYCHPCFQNDMTWLVFNTLLLSASQLPGYLILIMYCGCSTPFRPNA